MTDRDKSKRKSKHVTFASEIPDGSHSLVERCEKINPHRYNPHFRADMKKNRSEGLGDEELAKRSLTRAEGKCACFGKKGCHHKEHNHENHWKGKIHCGNVLTRKCVTCDKYICLLCWKTHTAACVKYIPRPLSGPLIKPLRRHPPLAGGFTERALGARVFMVVEVVPVRSPCQSSLHGTTGHGDDNHDLCKCEHCPKTVCHGCYPDHKKAHQKIILMEKGPELTCESSLHRELGTSPGSHKLFKCRHCPKIICGACWEGHMTAKHF